MKKFLCAGLVCSLILSGCSFSEKNKEDSKEEENIGKGYFKGDVLRTKDAEIKIKETKLVESFDQDDKDGPYLAFTYEFTNKSKDNLQPNEAWYDHFKAVVDNKDTQEDLETKSVINDNSDGKLSENSHVLIKPKDHIKALEVYKIDKKASKVLLQGYTEAGDEKTKLGHKTINIEK